MSDETSTATIKFGQGFEAPWYVSRGDTPQEIGQDLIAVFNLTVQSDFSLGDIIALAAKTAQGIWQGHSTLGGTPQAPAQQPAAPQGGWAAQSRGNAPAAPQGDASGGPADPHGPKVWKDFTSKQGNHVKGWFCPSNDRSDQCKPEYVK